MVLVDGKTIRVDPGTGEFLRQEDACALNSFVQNVYWGKDVSDSKNHDLILQNTFPLYFGSVQKRPGGATVDTLDAGTGLLITKNGYFLTAGHCVPEMVHFGAVDLYKKKRPISHICAVNRAYDLCLGKIELDGPCEPFRYRFMEFSNNALRLPASMQYVTKGVSVGGSLMLLEGRLEMLSFYESMNLQRRLLGTGDLLPGDSGCPVVVSGGLAGFFVAATSNGSNLSVRIDDACTMIMNYVCGRQKGNTF